MRGTKASAPLKAGWPTVYNFPGPQTRNDLNGPRQFPVPGFRLKTGEGGGLSPGDRRAGLAGGELGHVVQCEVERRGVGEH